MYVLSNLQEFLATEVEKNPPFVKRMTISYHFSPSSRHACVIRGQVMTVDGTPLVGVNISFVNNPLFGYTISIEPARSSVFETR